MEEECAQKKALQVGKDLVYGQIPSSSTKDGWIESEKYLPVEYDLVMLKPSFTGKTVPGWWTGTRWDGHRVNSQNYKFWKRLE